MCTLILFATDNVVQGAVTPCGILLLVAHWKSASGDNLVRCVLGRYSMTARLTDSGNFNRLAPLGSWLSTKVRISIVRVGNLSYVSGRFKIS